MSVTYRSNDSQAGAIPVDTKVKTTNTADGQVQHVNVDSIVEMPSLDDLIEARTQTPTKSDALNVQIGPGDPISNIPIVMDFQHHQIHEGETYQAFNLQASLGTNTVKYAYNTKTSTDLTKLPHLLVECDVYNGSARVDIYEGSTYSGGSPVTSYNRKRSSTDEAGSSVVAGVTSADGTQIDSFFSGAGVRTSGVGRVDSEWDLKSNVTYRIDLVGLVANTQAIMRFKWYEDMGV